MEHEYDGIDTHYEHGSGRHAAINIKHYGSMPDSWDTLPDDVREMLYQQTCEEWHELAREAVRARGYDFYFTEGRMGGWLVPFYQPSARAMGVYSWPGQGGRMGYPRYPDIDNIGERSRFRALQRDIKALMDAIPEMLEYRAEMYREDAAEAIALTGAAH